MKAGGRNEDRAIKLRRLVVALGVTTLVGSLGVSAAVSAQTRAESQCSYSECSLRLKSGFFNRSLVRGAEEEQVIGLGLWVGSLDPVFVGSPEAITLGAQFRHRHNTGAGVALGGVVLTLVGAFIVSSGADALHRAIWEYNGTAGR